MAANREAHTQMVAVLTGEGTETVDVTGNTVSLNLAVIIETVKAQLVNAGFELAARIPEVERAVHHLRVRGPHQGPDRLPAPGEGRARPCPSSACC